MQERCWSHFYLLRCTDLVEVFKCDIEVTHDWILQVHVQNNQYNYYNLLTKSNHMNLSSQTDVREGLGHFYLLVKNIFVQI